MESNYSKTIDFDSMFYDKEVTLNYTERVYIFTMDTVIHEENVVTTLDRL